MKKLLLLMAFSFCIGNSFAQSEGDGSDIPLTVEWSDPTGPLNPFPKTPIAIPHLSIIDHTLYLSNSYADYVFQILSSDGLVYSTYVPAGTTTINIPSTLSGFYEIRLVTSTYYYKGYITFNN